MMVEDVMAMTTNTSECFNGVLKCARGLTIAAMVEFTWCELVAYFHDWHKEITSDLSLEVTCGVNMPWGFMAQICTKLQDTMRAFNHEVGIYQLVTPYKYYSGGGRNHNHEINIVARTFGCGQWQNIKLHCLHAIKVFQCL